jgi:hypothetical protein
MALQVACRIDLLNEACFLFLQFGQSFQYLPVLGPIRFYGRRHFPDQVPDIIEVNKRNNRSPVTDFESSIPPKTIDKPEKEIKILLVVTDHSEAISPGTKSRLAGICPFAKNVENMRID